MNYKTNRHLIAFALSAILYGVAIGSILGFEVKSENTSITKIENFQTVKIALINKAPIQENFKTQQPLEEKIIEPTPKKIEPIIEKKLSQAIIEKPIEKPIEKKTEPKIEPKIEQIAQIIKNEPKQEIKQIVKTEQQPQKEVQITQKIEPKEKPVVAVKPSIEQPQKIVKIEPNNEELKNKKRAYFQLVKNTIEKHKYYPQNALRRGIECDIKVKFIISQMGQLVSLELIEGNRIFHESVKEAIQSSFPLLPPKNLLAENEVVSLVISYTIN